MSLCEKYQEEFIEKNGMVGEVIPKSKLLKKERYKLYREAKKVAEVFARKKLIYMKKEQEPNDAILSLISDFGYNLQTVIY